MSEKTEVEKAAGLERWWSGSARNHTVVVDVGGKMTPVKFKNFSISLDLANPEDKALSAGLKAHSQCGKSFYLVEGAVPAEVGGNRRVALLRMLRKIITDNMSGNRVRVVALEQVRALFTTKELAASKLDVVSEDVDALLDLATRTKSLKGLE